MVYRSALFALIIFFALDRRVVAEGSVSAIPTAAFKFESPASRPVDELWSFGDLNRIYEFYVVSHHI